MEAPVDSSTSAPRKAYKSPQLIELDAGEDTQGKFTNPTEPLPSIGPAS